MKTDAEVGQENLLKPQGRTRATGSQAATVIAILNRRNTVPYLSLAADLHYTLGITRNPIPPSPSISNRKKKENNHSPKEKMKKEENDDVKREW